jgi:hypothetical protein
MRVGLLVLVLLTGSCVAHTDPGQIGINGPPSGPLAPGPAEVARSRGSDVSDRIDSLVANVLGLGGEFLELETGPAFIFTAETDSAFQRLARIPEAVPRLVDCLGWDRLSRATWRGTLVLVGTVCGDVLAATPYAQHRVHPYRLSPSLLEAGWGDYRNPPLDKLRAVQRAWRRELLHDPPNSCRHQRSCIDQTILKGPIP